MNGASKYTRTPEDLRRRASLYWPRELSAGEAEVVIARLLQTQEQFLGILSIADREPTSWKQVLSSCSLAPNLFLKHLVVLADVGGEIINRITPLKQTQTLHFRWKNEEWEYHFKCAHNQKMSNSRLKIDTENLLREEPLNGCMEDMIMLVLFGGLSSNLALPEEVSERCSIGLLLGDRDAIERFIRPRYILGSRIIGGARANALGQAAQQHVLERLKRSLDTWTFQPNGTIPGISQTGDQRDITFDIVARSPAGKYFAIEVSFQVTTNSTIERKSGQAKSRYEQLHAQGSQIAYVIDGSGNFERQSALETICTYSDCTVAFTEEELDVLVEFLRANGGETGGSLE